MFDLGFVKALPVVFGGSVRFQFGGCMDKYVRAAMLAAQLKVKAEQVELEGNFTKAAHLWRQAREYERIAKCKD